MAIRSPDLTPSTTSAPSAQYPATAQITPASPATPAEVRADRQDRTKPRRNADYGAATGDMVTISGGRSPIASACSWILLTVTTIASEREAAPFPKESLRQIDHRSETKKKMKRFIYQVINKYIARAAAMAGPQPPQWRGHSRHLPGQIWLCHKARRTRRPEPNHLSHPRRSASGPSPPSSPPC